MGILAICMPIFIIIILGNILLNIKLIDHEFINSSNKLVMNVFLPVLLFNEITKSSFREVFSYQHVAIVLCCILIMFLISFPLAKVLRLTSSSTRTFVSNSFRANAAFIGLPVCFYAYGDQGLAAASIFIAFIIPVNNVLGIVAHSAGGYTLSDIKEIIKSTFFNPLIIACILAIIFSILNIVIPAFISRTFSIIGGAALPLALLGIGVNTNLECIKGNKKIIAICSMMKLIVLPLIAFVFFKILSGGSFGMLEKVAIVLLSSPSAQINYILASGMKGDSELASGGIIFSTVFSALSFIFWIGITAA